MLKGATDEPSTLKGRIVRIYLKILLKLRLIKIVDGKFATPPILSGASLWLFRAWLYLPIPLIFGAILFACKFVGSRTEMWLSNSILVLVILGYVFISYRYEKKNGLRMPTVFELTNYALFTLRLTLFIVVLLWIEHWHFDPRYMALVLIMQLFNIVTLPWSVILESESARKSSRNAGILN